VPLERRLSQMVRAGILVQFPNVPERELEMFTVNSEYKYFVWASTKEQTKTDGKAHKRLKAARWSRETSYSQSEPFQTSEHRNGVKTRQQSCSS
jgi:hypothetical protein